MKTESQAHTIPPPYPYPRDQWHRGPWDDEPDRVEFIASGFACLIVRGPVGALCGYVGVPENHPAFGKEAEAVPCRGRVNLNYASLCAGYICHVPKAGMPDKVWWLGFDCAHWGDIVPVLGPGGYGTYKDIGYVKRETQKLAKRLKRMVAR
jgi:hypothetical protein